MGTNKQMRLIQTLADRDGRYAWEAFVFVSEAIGKTSTWVKNNEIQALEAKELRGGEGETFHVNGRELLQGLRRLAQERWSHLAPCVLQKWGVRQTEDFGEIVFLMVHEEEMQWSARSEDRIEDFAGGYDFATAFLQWDD